MKKEKYIEISAILNKGIASLQEAKDKLDQEYIASCKPIERSIEWEGHTYWYEYKSAINGIDICLSTRDPTKYCNGFHKYSSKDPGDGMAFVVIGTNNPDFFAKKN